MTRDMKELWRNSSAGSKIATTPAPTSDGGSRLREAWRSLVDWFFEI